MMKHLELLVWEIQESDIETIMRCLNQDFRAFSIKIIANPTIWMDVDYEGIKKGWTVSVHSPSIDIPTTIVNESVKELFKMVPGIHIAIMRHI